MTSTKVWRVNMDFVEESYHSGCYSNIGIACDAITAGRLAVKEVKQGEKYQSVTITSITYIGTLSF